MAQLSLEDLDGHASRLGFHHAAGPVDDRAVVQVDVAPVDGVGKVPRGALAIVASDDVAPYRIDVAVRQASARQLAGIVFTGELALADTAKALAGRGGVPVFLAPSVTPAGLAVAVDRLLVGGASEAMIRSRQTIDNAVAVAETAGSTVAEVLESANAALGADLVLVDDPTTSASEHDAVCIGEVPIGRLVAPSPDAATTVALPVIAALLSRTAQRRMRERHAGTQSRADLLVELVLAESSRVEAFVGQAARLGFPIHQSHVVAWLKAAVIDQQATSPRSVNAALELFALQLVDGRPEVWHVAFLQDDLLIVATEEHGAPDHQRRLREVATTIQNQARTLAEPGVEYTLGLGTPRGGASGLRLSAAEARVAAESAIAAGRVGGVEITDVTGLRRVLLDFYASPIARELLGDVLKPLDDLGAERSLTAVRTILAYLAHDRSLARAGRELNLHRNAIAYRLTWIREALQLDLDDPDTRFAIELACRVRLLSATQR